MKKNFISLMLIVIFGLIIIIVNIYIFESNKEYSFIKFEAYNNIPVPEKAIVVDNSENEVSLVLKYGNLNRLIKSYKSYIRDFNRLRDSYIANLVLEGWLVNADTGKSFYVMKDDDNYLLIITKQANNKSINITIRKQNTSLIDQLCPK
ncbi:MAG: hypothetical protein IMX04_06075 [Candidatus Carbobacillus altaicus]|nr:hypothetical protein [Candidatus Carbobacillus altaicus]